MAKRSFTLATWTPVAVADTIDFTDSGFQALQGGSATQRSLISEVYMGGQATAAKEAIMVVARDSVVGTNPTALAAGEYDAPLDPATAALAAPVVAFEADGTTQPRRDTAAGLLSLAFNAFGGIVRWVAAPDEELIMLGASASFGEMSLSAFTGGSPGLMGSHIIYETL